jgi:hypothetical protein
MEQPIERKGMSKGCLVALIVAGAIVLIIIAGVTFICVNRDKVMQAVTKIGMNQIKTEVGRQNFVGLDTARFNALVDSFVTHLKTEPLSDSDFAKLSVLQQVTADRKIDSRDVSKIMDMIVACYPNLAAYRPDFTPTDSASADSVPSATAPPNDTVTIGDSVTTPK